MQGFVETTERMTCEERICAGVDVERLTRMAEAGGLAELLADAEENARIYHDSHGVTYSHRFEGCAAPSCVKSRALLGLP